MDQNRVVIVFHSHEDECGDEQIKFIGVFATEEKAKSVVEQLSTQPGFKDYRDGFSVEWHTLDRIGWSEGFVSD